MSQPIPAAHQGAEHSPQQYDSKRPAQAASSMSHVDAHGAVDLSAGHADAPASHGLAADAPGGITLDAPLITQANDQTFQDVTATSQTVPVLMVMWSSSTLGGREILATLEAVVRQYAGRFQLVTVEAEQAPQLVQVLQLQALPTVVALVAGRPVPLFQGAAQREQITPMLDELLKAAAQMGVTGRISVTQEDTEEPIPDEYQPALAAQQAGDTDLAVTEWERVVERLPKDQRAKDLLAQARIAQRVAVDAADSPAAQADRLFQAGHVSEAFDVLLALVKDDPVYRAEARTRLLDLFRVAGNTPEVRHARTKLSTLLMV